MNLGVIFLTGLTVGGLSCLAVQGGLLASIVAIRKKSTGSASPILATFAFLGAKLTVYTLLGFVLGTLGEGLKINPRLQLTAQLLAGFYMIAVALNLLNVHPIFRLVIIEPPRFFKRLIKKESKSSSLLAPLVLGLMTVFVPCGTTLAMEALSVSSGSALFGAAILFVFTLGTFPLFFGLGLLSSAASRLSGKLLKFAALTILYLGASSINGSFFALGSPLAWQNIAANFPIEVSFGEGGEKSSGAVGLKDGVQVLNIDVLPSGYSPSYFVVKVGVPVRMNLKASGGLGCTSVLVVPKFDIVKVLSKDAESTVEFTPRETGRLSWTCSMGMYSGVIEVI